MSQDTLTAAIEAETQTSAIEVAGFTYWARS